MVQWQPVAYNHVDAPLGVGIEHDYGLLFKKVYGRNSSERYCQREKVKGELERNPVWQKCILNYAEAQVYG